LENGGTGIGKRRNWNWKTEELELEKALKQPFHGGTGIGNLSFLMILLKSFLKTFKGAAYLPYGQNAAPVLIPGHGTLRRLNREKQPIHTNEMGKIDVFGKLWTSNVCTTYKRPNCGNI
jgi:hypothetical protein